MPWFRGWGWWFWWNPWISYLARLGYIYVGPCRSGFGPWAFFLTPSGTLVHAWQLFGLFNPYMLYSPVPSSVEQELTFLEKQKELIEEQIKQLKDQLKKKTGGEKK
ncbi:MAG: hypothetical protein ACP6IS_00465 [Candidatus Asgardarchaeia archaeon]